MFGNSTLCPAQGSSCDNHYEGLDRGKNTGYLDKVYPYYRFPARQDRSCQQYNVGGVEVSKQTRLHS